MLHTAGFTPSEVTKLLPGTSRTTIWRTITKLNDEQTLNHRPGAGRPFKVDEAGRHRLCAIASSDHLYTSASQVTEKMRTEGVEISNRTTRRYLNRLGFRCLLPKRVPLLTDAYIARRLEGCQRWRTNSWSNIFLCDESTFQLYRNTIRVWVPVDRDVVFAAPRHGPKVRVWGGISERGLTPLKLFTTKMDSHLYTSILEECHIADAEQLYPDGCRLQHDNAPTHSSKNARAFLANQQIDVLDWSANSPDLNSIENLYSWMKRQIEKRRRSTQQKLEKAISNVWESLTAIEIKIILLTILIDYMSALETEVVAPNTKYMVDT